MRAVVLVLVAACGASQTPLLAGVPHPNTAAVAGIAAATAAAVTLASPSRAQQKPEDKVNEDTPPQKVTEQVPSGVFDRLDAQKAAGSAAPAPSAAQPKPAGIQHIPSPEEAAEQSQDPH